MMRDRPRRRGWAYWTREILAVLVFLAVAALAVIFAASQVQPGAGMK